MPICKFCKAEIDKLKLVITKEQTIYFDGKDFDEDEYMYPTETEEKWVCPECNKELDICDEGEATEFLEDDKLKGIVKEKINMMGEENP